jgi:hypothetical protein
MGSETRWPKMHEQRLAALVATHNLSYGMIFKILNKEFTTDYTRCGVCGKARRLGLRNPMNQVSKEASKPKHLPTPRRGARKAPPLRQKYGPVVVPRNKPDFLVEEPLPKDLDLLQVCDDDGCRWPHGDGPFTFCGHKRYENRPYCGFHVIRSLNT